METREEGGGAKGVDPVGGATPNPVILYSWTHPENPGLAHEDGLEFISPVALKIIFLNWIEIF